MNPTTDKMSASKTSRKKNIAPDGNHRVQLELQNRAVEELDSLCEEAGFSTRADAIRYGLKLLKWVTLQTSEGNEILIKKKKDGETRIVEFIR